MPNRKKQNKHNEDILETVSDSCTQAYHLCVKADALRLASFHKEAVNRYLRALMFDRESSDCYYGLGICYKNLGNFEKAILNFEKAQRIKEFDFSIYFELGVCYLVSGDVVKAVKNLMKSLKLNPKNLNAQVQLAMCHEIMEEYDMALMIYKKIIESSPSYIKAYNHMSALLMTLEDYYEASLVFNKILKLNPDYHRAYLGIGICFDKLGRKNDAVRYYKKFMLYKPYSQHVEYVKKRLTALKSKSGQGKLQLVK